MCTKTCNQFHITLHCSKIEHSAFLILVQHIYFCTFIEVRFLNACVLPITIGFYTLDDILVLPPPLVSFGYIVYTVKTETIGENNTHWRGNWQNQRPTRKATYRLKVADVTQRGQSEGTGTRRDTAEDGNSKREKESQRGETEKNTNDHKKRTSRKARKATLPHRKQRCSASALHLNNQMHPFFYLA